MSCCSSCNKTNCTCVNGRNAFTQTSASFVQPSVGGTVSVSVSNLGQLSGQWVALGSVVVIASGGYYLVTGVTGSPQTFVLQNLGYANNAAPGTTIAQSSLFSPGGFQGPAGTSGALGASILYNDHSAVTLLGSAGSSAQLAFSYSMPDGTLAPNFSELECSFLVERTVLASQGGFMLISLGGQSVYNASFFSSQSAKFMSAKVRIVRVTATQVRVVGEYSIMNNVTSVIDSFSGHSAIINVPNLDTGGPRAVTLSGGVGATADSFVCRYFTVKRFLI